MTKPEESLSLSVSKKRQGRSGHLIFTSNSSDTNGLWMIENFNPKIGGLIKIEDSCRLKHISTGYYLAIDSDGHAFLSEISSTGCL